MQRHIDPIETVNSIEEKSRRVLVWGATLFLVGLVEGGLIPWFTNPRMGLSAHLTAVQGGMALLIIGLAWNRLQLSDMQLRWTYYLNVAGIVTLWLALTAAAVLGTRSGTPIAGAGYGAGATAEFCVEALLTVGAVLAITGGGLFFWGLELTTWKSRAKK
ncbi:hydroxylaminobenzene mutase [Litorivivens lipolytica]|uniref:Hydroxylaminobenzene mutase n=1 Tax=Litorivivens lipolytica TaxID=1524264 RepID=A0A7W4W5D8_9GAMM|nr:hypothetical protein [Litorivivens lipolytica]MBB3047670.1 hydroxylaminobenzene mutase [Litorivivens lipolytica]